MSPFLEAFIGGIAATLVGAPIWAGVVILIVRFWNKRQRKALRFLVGEWESGYEINNSGQRWAREKLRIRENIWRNRLIVESYESDPPNNAWVGELNIDENMTTFGTWENKLNPVRNGYCVFHVTRNDVLFGYTIVTKYEFITERFLGSWIVCSDTEKLERELLNLNSHNDKKNNGP